MSNKSPLSGRGEENTFKLYFKILLGAFKESYGIYLTFFVLSSWAGYRSLFLLEKKPLPFIDIVSSMLSPIMGLGVFIPSFSFVVIGVFPSFSESLRERMKATSRTSNLPLIRVMLDHFCLVLITSTMLLLFSLVSQVLLSLHKSWAVSASHFWISLATSFSISAGFWFLLITFIELLRSVRTMYIMIIADYS
jgi:hypothetical protein